MFVEYGELSTELYQLTKPVGTSLGGDLEYYRNKLMAFGGKALEAGVGTGRLLIPFLKAGIDIAGVDVSPHMLEACRQNCLRNAVKAELFLQDLLELELPHKFDTIIMPTGSFCLLPGHSAAMQVLAAFKNHLKEKGRLIVDLTLPTDFFPEQSNVHSFPTSSDSGILFTTTPVEIDWAAQKTVTIHRYEKWVRGELIKSELSQFILHWYGLAEFKAMLETAGYSHIEIVFDYGRSGKYESIATVIASMENH